LDNIDGQPARVMLLLTASELYQRRVDCNAASRSLHPTADYSLTVQEERLILLYYHQKINDICKYFKFGMSTVLTSHLTFARVHLAKPILDGGKHDLKHIMLAAVYLASKVDEEHTELGKFCDKIPGTDRKQIEELEFVLLDWLDFDIFMELPVVPLATFVADIFLSAEGQTVSAKELHAAALQSLSSIYMTDAPFLFNPAIIALSCLLQTAVRFKVEKAVEEYLEKVEEKLPGTRELVESAGKVATGQATTLDPRYLKVIDGKLSECRKKLLLAENHDRT
jgi:hypothetical protein